eukprot:scaffold18655_cov61-Phaeocystis_antarctica.AAC.3
MSSNTPAETRVKKVRRMQRPNPPPSTVAPCSSHAVACPAHLTPVACFGLSWRFAAPAKNEATSTWLSGAAPQPPRASQATLVDVAAVLKKSRAPGSPGAKSVVVVKWVKRSATPPGTPATMIVRVPAHSSPSAGTVITARAKWVERPQRCTQDSRTRRICHT